MIASINPATGETLQQFAEHSLDEVEHRVQRAHEAAALWRATPLADRVAVVAAAGRILQEEKARFGEMMTREMGKTLASAIAEAEKCASGCRYYAENAARILAPEVLVDNAEERGEARYEPLGTVLAIMPWNFPFWQVVRFAAPALVAGNVGLLKHASNVPECALALEDLFHRAGAPASVFQTLLIPSSRVDGVIADRRIHAVTLTGSEGAGRSVAESAGRHLKKTVLELGGSDPFIVCASADVSKAAEVAITARNINNGQSCIAAKRFIIVDAVYDAFMSEFVRRMKSVRVGDPMSPDTDVGPLATRAIRHELHEQVQQSIRAGATLVCGGAPIDGPGNYYQPTILADIPKDAVAYSEELFGPVASVFRVADTEAAIAMANDTKFGLGACAWSNDDAERELLSQKLDAGSVFINAMVASDPRFPFGGVKASGYGRELGSWGLREFMNLKTVRRFGRSVAAMSKAE